VTPGHSIHEDDKGIPISEVHFVNYENATAAFNRRINAMVRKFKFDGARFLTWDMSEAHTPLLIVPEAGPLKLTATGRRFLTAMRAVKGHKVIIFDGFADAIVFEGNSRSMENRMKYAVITLNHWCKVCDCSIFGILNPSRQGAREGNLGYAPTIETVPRQVLTMKEITVATTVNGRKETQGTGVYRLEVFKRSDGKIAPAQDFIWEDDCLVPPAGHQAADPHGAIVNAVINAYHDGKAIHTEGRINANILAIASTELGLEPGKIISNKEFRKKLDMLVQLRKIELIKEKDKRSGCYAPPGTAEKIAAVDDISNDELETVNGSTEGLEDLIESPAG
jgi:hypothetical protein